MSQRLRSLLFVPGDRPDRIASARSRATDAVVIDLEDAVAAQAKESVRDAVIDLLRQREPSGAAALMVRVNARNTPWFAQDVAALGPVLDRLDAILLPKASDPEDVAVLDRLLVDAAAGERVGIVPIIETAVGVLAAAHIASAAARVRTLLFGSADLSAELGITPTPDGTELLQARSLVVLAAAAAGLHRPLDGPYLTLRDPDGLARSARAARALGFGGMAVIHPEQLGAVQTAFAVTPEELDWARRVDVAFTTAEASGLGLARLEDGTFVDEPVVRRARALLAEAGNASGCEATGTLCSDGSAR